MQGWLDSVAEKMELVERSEDAVVSKVGRDLYRHNGLRAEAFGV
jgi:hypothetical protein